MLSCFQTWTFALARVTPAGHIEDEGDFSDFFAVPPDNLDPLEWEQMQQQQDEVRGLGSRVECFCFGAFLLCFFSFPGGGWGGSSYTGCKK